MATRVFKVGDDVRIVTDDAEIRREDGMFTIRDEMGGIVILNKTHIPQLVVKLMEVLAVTREYAHIPANIKCDICGQWSGVDVGALAEHVGFKLVPFEKGDK